MATIGFKASDAKFDDGLDDFNFDDFSFDVPEPKDDRHPIVKALRPIGKGMKDYVTNSSNLERFFKNALPLGYGQAYDLAQEAHSEFRQLYNSVGDEIKPVKETSKSLMRKVLPSLDGKIPKGLKNRLEEFSKAEEQWQSRQGDGREEQLGSLLTSIFETKEQERLDNRKETDEREKLRQGFEQIRHKDQISQLDAIRIATQQQAAFTNKIGYNVAKKQLELQYRMFWAMVDLNKEQKASNARVISNLQAITTNTSLPDMAKVSMTKDYKKLIRNKFLEHATQGMFGGAQDYFRRFAGNLRDQTLLKLKSITQPLDGMGQMADGMADTMQSMGDMPGFSAKDEIISQLMSFPMDWVSNRASGELQKILAKRKGLRRGGQKASYIANSIGDRIQQKLNDPMANWKAFEGLRDMLRAAAPNALPESRMEVDKLDTAHEASYWRRSNSKSLDEVIPGLLARIHREIKILRTGDENTPLLTYDFTKNKFSNTKEQGSSLRKMIAGRHTERANTYANSIIKRIDRSGKLTDQQREKLRQQLIQRAVNGESIDITKSHAAHQWGGGEDGIAIANAFGRYLRVNENGEFGDNAQSYKRQIELMQQHRGIVGGIGDPRVLIQQMVNSGQLEQLKELGIVDENNNLNRKLYSEWLMGQEEQELAPASTTSPGPKFKPKRQRRAPSSNIRQSFTPSSSATAQPASQAVQQEVGSVSLAGSSIESNVQVIADLLKSMDEKYTHASSSNHDVLQAMLDQLAYIAANGGGMGGGNGAFVGPMQPAARSYSNLWDHLKGKGREGFDKAKAHAKAARARGLALWEKYSPGAKKKVGEIWGQGQDMAKNTWGRLKDYYGDVVVSGESFPRLRANLIKAGAYRDKLTGRVITSLEDITGDVVDAAGNTVITLEEFYNSYVTGTVNKKVKELFTQLKGKLEDWKNKLQHAVPATIQNLKDKASRFLQKAKEMLPPYDVYVKTDMTKPLLYANSMRYDMYTSAKNPSKYIRHPRDIDGPVMDDKGNMVLSEDHIKAGLCDVVGDPIGGIRLAVKGLRKAKAAWEMMRDAAVGMFGVLKGGLGNVNEYFKNFFTPFADIITNSKKTVTLLEAIRDILDERLPGRKKVRGDADGDGIREGSIEDQHRQKEKEEEKREKRAEAREEREARSGGGMIGKLLAAFGGKFGGGKKDHDEEEDEDHDGSMLDDAADVAEIADALRGNGGGASYKDMTPAERRKAAQARLKRMKAARAKPGMFSRMGGRLKGMGGGRLGRLAKWGLFNTDGVRAAGRVAGGVGSPMLKGAGWLGGKALGGAAAVGGGLMGQSRLARLARWGMFNTDIVRGGAKATGMLGKGLWGAAKMAPKALGAAGLLYSGYSMANNLSEGNYGSAAVDAGLGAASLATTVGGLGGLAGLGSTVMGGLGAVLASPFLLPGLAVAGAGALAYGLYKYSQKTKLTNLSELRLAQYGVSKDDEDGKSKIFALEQMLEPYMTIKDDGNMYLDEKKMKIKEVADLFDIHREQDMQLFNGWYKRRFVPVYRKWMSEMRKIDKDGKIAKIESIIPGKDKLRIAESAVSACQDAYSYMAGWSTSRSKLQVDAKGVQNVFDAMRVLLEKERENDGGPKAEANANAAVASSTASAAALAAKAVTDSAHYEAKDKDGNTVDVTGMDVGDLTEKIKKGALTVSVAVALPQSLVHKDPSRLDALASVRYKAYGLTSMPLDKVRMLGALEMMMGDHLSDDNDKPKLNITTDKVLEAAASVFGVPNGNGEHAQRWKTWFNGRFLPVFLLWAGALRAKTGKKDLRQASDMFAAPDQLTTARAIVGAQGIDKSGGKVPVWQISSSPWNDDYALNDDPDSTASNIEAIRLLADKIKLGEVSARTTSPKQGGQDETKAAFGWFKTPGGRTGTRDLSAKGPGGGLGGSHATTATGDVISSPNAAPLGGMGDAVKFSGGGGGVYTDLPASQGNGWGANRDLIIKAAKMAGVDPKALIATIAIESSFNPSAAAKGSTAKGLGQHVDGSWLEDLRLHGKKFGIPNGVNQFDARASALMTAMRLKTNAQTLQKNLGRPATTADLYMAHLLGLGGASKFLRAAPNAIAAEEAPTAAKQHPEYFFNNGKPRTVKEVYDLIAQKLSKRPAEFGVTDADLKTDDSMSVPTATASATPTAAEPGKQQTGQAPQSGLAPRGSGGYAGGDGQKATAANTPSAGSARLNTPVTMEDGKAAVVGTGPAIVKSKDAKYTLILQREESEDDGTYGTLRLPDGTTLNTLELPWRNNEAQTSCIPPGSYSCKKRPSKAFGEAYEVAGVPGRSAILIHAGNAAGDASKGMKADSKGCILLGMDRGRQGKQKVITASKAAMKLFYEKMQDMPFQLEIRPGKGGLGTGDSKPSVSFDAVRPKIGSSDAQVSSSSTNNVASFAPKSSAPASGQAPLASSSDLPRYNTTTTSIAPGGPTKTDMQKRDEAMQGAVGPKLDSMNGTLTKQLDVLSEIRDLLKNKSVTTTTAATEPEKAPPVSSNKVRPQTDTTVPVPQRRSV